MELAAADDGSPIPARQFRRRKSLGELVQGIKMKYSREKMAKDSDPDSRNLGQTDTNTSATTSSGSQSILIPNALQNRHSVPVPIPERSASIPYERLSVSPVSSTPPRLDALPDFALDGMQRASTFRDGLEKAVNDINTKYGDSTKTFIPSTSPTNSVAVRDKHNFRLRHIVPIYGDIPKPRPVIGELWTALKSQDECLQPSKPHQDTSTQPSDPVSPFHDSQIVENAPSESATTSGATAGTAVDDMSTSTSQLPQNESQEILSAVENAEIPAEINLNKDNSYSDSTVSGNADEETDIKSQDKADDCSTGADFPVESTDKDSLRSQDSDIASALSQGMSPDQSFSLAQDSAANEADLDYIPRANGAARGRNSSAPSVAALVSKFRRMQQSPEQGQQGDGTQEQDQGSVESNSRFIQSYRQRSEDSDNENSLLSTVSSDNTGGVATY